MDSHQVVLLLGGGLLAGMINVMAGGAGFMTFPLLIAAGMSEIEANASNFVALLPVNIVGAVAQRHELRNVGRHLPLRLTLAVAGGLLGSLLLIRLGAAAFERAVPWLLFAATISFAAGPPIKRYLETHHGFDGARWLWLSLVLEFAVYIYGGYFGLGMGIVLLAIYGLFGIEDIHQANALRNATIALMTVVSVALFAQAGLIRWPQALVMVLGAVIGSYGMVRIARRVPQPIVRAGILIWAVVMTAAAFWRAS